MNIGEAAAQSGMPAKTIRYYEEIGLIAPASRTEGGYRDYGHNDIQTLLFLRRARDLGFTIKDCSDLLSLYQDRDRASSDVKAMAQRRVEDIDRKILELKGMRRTLVHLMDKCHGDDRPDCPILEDLAHGDGRSKS